MVVFGPHTCCKILSLLSLFHLFWGYDRRAASLTWSQSANPASNSSAPSDTVPTPYHSRPPTRGTRPEPRSGSSRSMFKRTPLVMTVPLVRDKTAVTPRMRYPTIPSWDGSCKRFAICWVAKRTRTRTRLWVPIWVWVEEAGEAVADTKGGRASVVIVYS